MERCKNCERLEKKILVLEERLCQLESQLKLSSTNSSKPPSSDGLKKKPVSLRENSGLKTGGQLGHDGATLAQVENPSAVLEHREMSCQCCGEELINCEVVGVDKRQEFDISLPKLAVTQHNGLTIKCKKCGTANKARFPNRIRGPVQYGPKLEAAAVYLSSQQLIPIKRTTQIFEDLLSIQISEGSVIAINNEAAEKLAPIQEAALDNLKTCEVKHVDESGVRVAGKLYWLHVTSNDTATHYRITEKRGDINCGIENVVVHDHFRPYFNLPNTTHALCNAHILRELKKLIEFEKEPWAADMSELLKFLCHKKNNGEVDADFIANASKHYDDIVKTGLDYHQAQEPLPGRKRYGKKRDGHNLLLRLHSHKNDVLRFLAASHVPFTNNQAEQDIRMIKTKQKISGSFRTLQGAQNFATTRGFISTAIKQKLNPLSALLAALA